MKAFFQRATLVLFGLAMAWIMVEAFVRLTNLAAPPELGAEFDRSPALFLPQSGRQHPWSSSEEDTFLIAVIGDSFTVGEGVQRDDARYQGGFSGSGFVDRSGGLRTSRTALESRNVVRRSSSSTCPAISRTIGRARSTAAVACS